MPAYQVTRRIDIAKPLPEVKAYLQDFRNWPAWSPWLIQEPDATLTYKGSQGEVDSSYAWEGKRIGTGSMLLSDISDNKLSIKLQFVKPFKSKANVAFELQPLGDSSTKVTWKMDSSLPFFMFFMKSMMVNMIGMDYARGLEMLKCQLETGTVLSKLKLVGERSQEAIHYVGVSASSTIEHMPKTWENGMAQLFDAIQTQSIEVVGAPFGLYDSMDMATTHMEFVICVPVASKTPVKKPLLSDTIKPCMTYVVQHEGEYEHIGNAWNMAYSASRADKVKVKRKPMGMEVYLNDPAETEPKDLLAEVVLFKK